MCSAPLAALPRCPSCAERRYPWTAASTDTAATSPVALLVGASFGAYIGVFAGLPGAAFGIAAGAAVVAASLATGVAGRAVARELARAADRRACIRAVHPSALSEARDERATVRGHVRVLVPAEPATAAVAELGMVSAGRFEIVDSSGASILCDDDNVELAALGSGLWDRRLELRNGDLVLAHGPVRRTDATGGTYRTEAGRLAFDGTLTDPVRIHVEDRNG